MLAAGIDDKSVTVVGIPSMSTRMFLFPRIEISLFCTETDDEVLKISSALPLEEAILADALIVVCSTVDFCETYFVFGLFHFQSEDTFVVGNGTGNKFVGIINRH